ncbi:N-acetylglucosamine-6-phosphate deacetylase [Cellulomonas pakistanensis]|uniref:N-acetylglucosamine-6-phosphate deacetylase n=1 Tax=Cellulomonas pakistanensis TaxID=992287 RepID=A0A919PDL2_9CELL|nr:amidohydrolase family protein [Cellulomonas pakistanensis]GIG36242.1 N-acetylglucosamine-6-phosphate deacetylase [Cellulomonas pakistanensis]
MPAAAAPVTLVADGVVRGASVAGPGWVRVVDGRIAATGDGPPPSDLPGAPGEQVRVAGVLAPGFVDIHHHGALGHDYGSASAEDAVAAADHHRRRGSTTLCASVATAPLAVLEERVDLLSGLVADGVFAGIHLEGPYLDAGHRGCHAPDLLRPPSVAELRRLVGAARGALRMVTLAPELPGAGDAIRYLVAEGVTVAVGHTSCTAGQARAAFDAGATVLTHAFNGMPPLHHREPGPLGAALFDERVTIELILDGHHVAPEPARVLAAVAPGRLALISDAMAATGLGDGAYAIGGSDVVVTGSVARATSNGSLAGSTIAVADAFAAAVGVLGLDVAAAVACASATPARALGLAEPRIAAGAPADLVAVEGGRVTRVLRAGRFVA